MDFEEPIFHMSTKRVKNQIILAFFWVGVGLFVMVLSYQLGLGGLHNPGPGLMPFLLGFLLIFVSICLLLTFLFKRAVRAVALKEDQGQVNYVRLCLVLASLFAYSLLLEPIGFLITTLLTLVILFWSMSNRWVTVLLASILTAFISYFLFSYLGIRFPQGIIKGL
jgi:putative tricarboxylic transport membrane protein